MIFLAYYAISALLTIIYCETSKGTWLIEMVFEITTGISEILQKYGLLNFPQKSVALMFIDYLLGVAVLTAVILSFPFLLIYLYWANR